MGLSRRLAMPVLACSARQVEDADAGGLAAGAGGGRNRDQRLERSGHRQPLADRRVDVVQEVGRRIGGVEVDGLGGVDRSSRRRRRRTRRRLRRAANAIASWNDTSVGSTRTRSRRRTATPASASDSSTVCIGRQAGHDRIGHHQRPVSPRSARSMPTSRVTPAPNRTLDAGHLEGEFVLHGRSVHDRPLMIRACVPSSSCSAPAWSPAPSLAPPRPRRPSASSRRRSPTSTPRSAPAASPAAAWSSTTCAGSRPTTRTGRR